MRPSSKLLKNVSFSKDTTFASRLPCVQNILNTFLTRYNSHLESQDLECGGRGVKRSLSASGIVDPVSKTKQSNSRPGGGGKHF